MCATFVCLLGKARIDLCQGLSCKPEQEMVGGDKADNIRLFTKTNQHTIRFSSKIDFCFSSALGVNVHYKLF